MTETPRALPTSDDSCEECRCNCGALLARIVDGGIELKCRRCRRTVVLRAGEVTEQWSRFG